LLNLYLVIRKRLGFANKLKILAYHSISDIPDYLNISLPVSIFKNQLQYLKNNYQVVSLEHAVNIICSKRLKDDIIVITFDDGYMDNYRNAFPLLKEFNIPATIFLTVNPIQQRQPLFIDALIYAIYSTTQTKLDLSNVGLGIYNIKSRKSKIKTINIINEYSKKICEKERNNILDEIFKKLNITFNTPYLRELMLTWDAVKIMQNRGISFGSHSLSHPVLSRITIDQAQEEISKSKDIMEDKIGVKINTFAYPYGGVADINEEVIELIKRNGFTSACTLIHGANKLNCNKYMLRRIMVGNNVVSKFEFISKALFATELSGIFDIVFMRSIRNSE